MGPKRSHVRFSRYSLFYVRKRRFRALPPEAIPVCGAARALPFQSSPTPLRCPATHTLAPQPLQLRRSRGCAHYYRTAPARRLLTRPLLRPCRLFFSSTLPASLEKPLRSPFLLNMMMPMSQIIQRERKGKRGKTNDNPCESIWRRVGMPKRSLNETSFFLFFPPFPFFFSSFFSLGSSDSNFCWKMMLRFFFFFYHVEEVEGNQSADDAQFEAKCALASTFFGLPSDHFR